MPKIKNNGVKIYYETRGEGEPLCMIMGWGGASNFWYTQRDILSENYKLILIDNRGVGRSSKPDFPYTMQIFVEDIKAVLDHLEIKKLHLMGCSMGGMIVQHFALTYPEMLKSLILVCTSSNMNIRYSGTIQPERLFSMTNLTPRALMTVMSLFLSKKYIDWLFSDKGRDERNRLMINIGAYVPTMKSMVYQWEAIKDHNTTDRLKEIKVPTLIIAGKHDVLLPPRHSKVLNRNITNSEFTILETGHGIWIESEDKFSKIVLDFLKRQKSLKKHKKSKNV
ncbi:MAG: alpha/beta fold hydrolase [Candidatus Helarchaeota archaeon]